MAAGAVTAAIATAPAAGADPQCADQGLSTVCDTPGHDSIIATPGVDDPGPAGGNYPGSQYDPTP